MAGPNKKSPRAGSQELTSRDLGHPGNDRARHPPRINRHRGATLEEVIVTRHQACRSACRTCPNRSPRSARTTSLKRGLHQMDDYARLVPGLAISDREPGGTTIVFRGVATSGLQFGAVSSSALYLDEQPITQSGRNPDPRLIDVERVEALRGPQGTLYGASSQSGTLRIITNKPDPDEARGLGRCAALEHRRRGHGLRSQRHDQRAAGRRIDLRCAWWASPPKTPASSTTC